MSKLVILLLSFVLLSTAVFATEAEVDEAEAEFERLFIAGEDGTGEEVRGGIKDYSKYQCGRRGKATGKAEEAARMEEERWEAGTYDAPEELDVEVDGETNAETNTGAEGEAEADAERGAIADNEDEELAKSEVTANAEEETADERHVEAEAESETAADEDEGEGEADAVRLAGGRPSTAAEFPWHVSFFFKGKHVCSGAIIGKRYVVANAQCFKNRNRRQYKVYAGKSYKDAKEEGAVGPFTISAIVIHGKFKAIKGGKYENDIALIKLNKDIRTSKKVSAVCLPEQAEKVTKTRRCFVSGFLESKGTLDDGELRGARVSVITNKQCKSKAGNWLKKTLSKNQFCAGGLRTDTGSVCKGDLGSPLVCELGKKSNVFILQGLYSFGKNDCSAKKKVPAAYTRLSSYVTWLKKNYRRLQKFKSTEKPRADIDEANEDEVRFENDPAILADDEE